MFLRSAGVKPASETGKKNKLAYGSLVELSMATINPPARAIHSEAAPVDYIVCGG
jgi:hypothetical protein